MYVALFAMPVFGLTISIAPPFLIVHSAQLLLLPLLICLQHHRLAGNRIRAPAAEQANTNVLLPTINPRMASDVSEYIEAPPTGSHDPGGLPQGAMTQERDTPNTSVVQMEGSWYPKKG